MRPTLRRLYSAKPSDIPFRDFAKALLPHGVPTVPVSPNLNLNLDLDEGLTDAPVQDQVAVVNVLKQVDTPCVQH